jgi:solute carrier family 35 protein E3
MFSMFDPKRIAITSMMPLAIAMAMNIVGMNLSLQISTITFYQITRVLLTPCVAVINFFFYGKTIPRMAAYALIPMCFGVALISYYDQKPAPVAGAPIKATNGLSVIVAIVSVFISGIYTVWVGTYQRKYEANGFQLLFNQAPLGGVILLYAVPWTDKFPNLAEAPMNTWWMILLSGFLAAMINLSQFFIIGGAGAVESTVVGHMKTCLIVVIGAFTGGRIITDKAALGILLALCSIFA